MFQIGELILYGSTGVCRVDAIEPRLFGGKEVEYYKLCPLYGEGQIFAPVDSPIFMRPILTKEQAMELIHRIPQLQEEPLQLRDQRQLAEHYRKFFDSHNCDDLVNLVKSIYLKGQKMNELGKKINSTDQQYFKRATNLLHGELAAALDIPLEQVEEFITAEIEKLS